MDRPFFYLLFPFILGILFTYYFEIGIILPASLVVLILLYLLYNIIKGDLNQRVLLFIFFTLGLALSILGNRSYLRELIDERHKFYGTIEDVLYNEEGKSRYIVSIDIVDGEVISREKLILTIIGERYFNIGNKLVFNAKLKLPAENTNPKLYNYRLGLRAQKIHTTASIRDYEIEDIDRSKAGFRYALKSRVHRDVEGLFNKYLSPDNASLMISIVLGRSSYLDENLLDIYRNMGLAHILAVSGLHIGIISGFIFFLLSRLGIKRKSNILFTLGVIWTYGFIIGFPPSILRANIMFTVLFYSQLIHEPYDSLNTLSFAALVLLLINPYYLFSIGFQLSFVATLSLVIFLPRITSSFYPYKNKLTDTLGALFSVHLGLIPIQAYYFNRISILSIIANIIIVPLLSFSLILATIMIIFSYGLSFLNPWLGIFLNIILDIQFILLGYLDRIPLNIIKIFSPDILAIIFLYILIFVSFKIIDISELGSRIARLMVIFLSMIILWNIATMEVGDYLEIHFIDVGQGDAILIKTRSANYLMDTGGSLLTSYDIGKNITLPYLEKIGVRKLDAVFISHFHEDHSQGLLALLGEVRIDCILSSYRPKSRDMARALEDSGIDFRILTRGDRLKLDKNINLDIVWPSKDLVKDYDENNMSLVSLLSFKDFKILFTGDLEREGEEQISKGLIPVDLLKVPHHGSLSSSTEGFLRVLKPRYGLIPVGRNNMYGHPSEEVLERYANQKTKLYRTDENGLVLLRIDNQGYEFKSFLKEGKKIKPSLYGFIEEKLFEIIYYIAFFLLSYILIRTSSWGGFNYDIQ